MFVDGEPEVCDLKLVVFVQEQVLDFEVPMYYLLLVMEVLNGVNQLMEVLPGNFFRETVAVVTQVFK